MLRHSYINAYDNDDNDDDNDDDVYSQSARLWSYIPSILDSVYLDWGRLGKRSGVWRRRKRGGVVVLATVKSGIFLVFVVFVCFHVEYIEDRDRNVE